MRTFCGVTRRTERWTLSSCRYGNVWRKESVTERIGPNGPEAEIKEV